MTQPRRVLFVHHRPELGGAPVSLSGLIKALDRSRFVPSVYCPEGPAAEFFARSGATVITGAVSTFTHVWASFYSGLRWLLLARELAHLPPSVRAFAKLLRTEQFDVVHLNDSPLVYFGAMAKLRSLPVVWHLRSSLAHGGADKRGRLISRVIDATAAAVIAIDSDVARSFRGARQPHVVHNAVDLERYAPQPARPAKARLGLPEDAVTVGLFGYLYARKGWPDLLEAGRRLVKRGVPAHFVFVGGGVRPPSFFRTPQGRLLARAGLASDEEGRARAMARDFGLDGRIHFLPFSSDPRDVYSALDIVTFPNRGEGLGRAVIEASACGRVIVASGSIDGAGLIRDGETGALVPRRSPDALAAVLERLIVDPELRARLGAQARRHAETNFDERRNAAKVMEIYEKVLAAR